MSGATEPGPGAVAAPIRTAVVGDVRVYREGLAVILDREPTIDVVGTGSDRGEAMACARDLRPDVLLLDLAMPGSIDAVRAIAAAHPHVKVLALCVPEVEG